MNIERSTRTNLITMDHATTGKPCLMVINNPKPSFIKNSLECFSKRRAETIVVLCKETGTKTLRSPNPENLADEIYSDVKSVVIFEKPRTNNINPLPEYNSPLERFVLEDPGLMH